MPRASIHPVNKSTNQDLKDNLNSLIHLLRNKAEINTFFETFLTDEERIMFSKRLMLHLMFEKGFKNSEIQSILAISNDTIRIHKIIYSKSSPEYKNILKKLSKKDEIKKFWSKLDDLVKPLDLAMKSRTDMKARSKFASGNWKD